MKQAFADHLLTTGRISSESLNSMSYAGWLPHEPIGRLAVIHGLLTGNDVDAIMREQKLGRGSFGQIAKHLELLTENQIRFLLIGQAARACLELLEVLVLAETLSMASGLEAMAEFISQDKFLAVTEEDILKAN